ncbi:MAG: hypothetical protein IJA11_08575 [Oscillospiraceae bacterium]|nr:hypothetical protein [Oscillospiraceae bacterium]
MTTRMITVSIPIPKNPEQRLVRKCERDEARIMRRCQRFADRLFNCVAVGYCVFALLACVLAAFAL